MIFPATDIEIKMLDGKELYYGYFMDMPDENLMQVLEDRPIDTLCEIPKIYKVNVGLYEGTYDIRLQLTNHLDEFHFSDTDNVYTDYPLYNKEGKWYSSFDSLVLGFTQSEVANMLSDRLYSQIDRAVVECNHRRFKWYIYCLENLCPDLVKPYTDKYPELML